jgi:uncharacterized protein (DUF2252 family)
LPTLTSAISRIRQAAASGPRLVRTLFIAGLLGGAACQPSMDTRTVFLINTLIDVDRDLIFSRPQLVAQKYEQMASGLQPFLRGTAAVYYRDISRYQGTAASLAHGAGAEQTQLYGDVHLENLGVTLDDSGPMFDVVDFDATLAGPFAWDVRRALLALRVAVSVAEGPDELAEGASAALAGSYARTISAIAAGAAPPPIRENDPRAGAIVSDLIADGRQRYDQREEISRYTELRDGKRVLRRSDELIDLPERYRDELRSWIASYRQSRHRGPGQPAQFEVLDAVQRLGMGVASWPNLRFWVLVRGDEPADAAASGGAEWLLEFKEERDPPQPIAWLGRGPLGSNGERVFAGTRCLLASRSSEPDLGYVVTGSVSLLVRRVLRGRRDLDVPKLAENLKSGRYGGDDVAALATTIGELMASGHARCGDAVAIAHALGDSAAAPQFSAFVEGSLQAVADDVRRLRRDLQRFREARDRLGPLLGAWPDPS